MVECPFCGEWTDRPHIRMVGLVCMTLEQLEAEMEPTSVPSLISSEETGWLTKLLDGVEGI
jgi:hypothetical protein